MVKACETCLTNRSQQRREPLIPSEISNGGNSFILLEWSRFPFNCRLHSCYWEIERLYEAQSVNIIKKLKMFSKHGISQMVRSDNGPQFISTEFKKFVKEWGFQHITSSPHLLSYVLLGRYPLPYDRSFSKVL